MRYINPGRAAFAVGVLLGFVHLGWSALVFAGVAESVLDFIVMLHFLDIKIGIMPFRPEVAGGLILVTAVLGAALGFILAVTWNYLSAARKEEAMTDEGRPVETFA